MSISSSQGSVESLFRWGEKCSHHFAANLFGKRCTKFHQNRPSLLEDTILERNILVSSFSGHTVYQKHNRWRINVWESSISWNRQYTLSVKYLVINSCIATWNTTANADVSRISSVKKSSCACVCSNQLVIMNSSSSRLLYICMYFFVICQEHTSEELDAWKLVRVHEDFRVIALGLPVPRYQGNPLDPPLRSRFQARDVHPIPFQVFVLRVFFLQLLSSQQLVTYSAHFTEKRCV